MKERLDSEINAVVRRVLVRHHIDLEKISVRTTRGVVRLWGEMATQRRRDPELTEKQIELILAEVKTIEGVRRVVPTLTG